MKLNGISKASIVHSGFALCTKWVVETKILNFKYSYYLILKKTFHDLNLIISTLFFTDLSEKALFFIIFS